jgi:hypothetical protein
MGLAGDGREVKSVALARGVGQSGGFLGGLPRRKPPRRDEWGGRSTRFIPSLREPSPRDVLTYLGFPVFHFITGHSTTRQKGVRKSLA